MENFSPLELKTGENPMKSLTLVKSFAFVAVLVLGVTAPAMVPFSFTIKSGGH